MPQNAIFIQKQAVHTDFMLPRKLGKHAQCKKPDKRSQFLQFHFDELSRIGKSVGTESRLVAIEEGGGKWDKAAQ